MEEIWREIDGYNGLYEISNLGNIKSKKRKINNRYYGGKILVPIQRNKKISKKVNQYDINGNFIKNWESISSIYKNLKISRSNILNCCKGVYKQAGGFIWRFDNEL